MYPFSTFSSNVLLLSARAATARWRPSKPRQTRIKFRHTPGMQGPTVYLRDLRDLNGCNLETIAREE